MSRLHKKKPAGEKKKRSTVQKSEKGSSVSASNSATVASPAKAKLEKKSVDVVIEPNFFQRAMEFFREVKVELKKVTWPTRKQTTGTTVVVIIFVFIVSAFLGLFDFSLSKLVQVVLA